MTDLRSQTGSIDTTWPVTPRPMVQREIRGVATAPRLSIDEERLLGLLRRGDTQRAIAHEFGCTRRTVERRARRIAEKLNVQRAGYHIRWHGERWED